MARPISDDELWRLIERLLPPPRPRRFRYPSRRPITNRQALTGILFVLRSGVPWGMLPREMGCASGVSCWRRLRDWQAAGLGDQVHRRLLDELRRRDGLDLSIVAADSGTVRAVGPGKERALIPRTAASRGPSTTWRPTPRVSRSRARSRAPTAPTASSWSG
jgi:transposase